MYDYLSIRADNNYSQKIATSDFVALVESVLDLKREGNVSFSKALGCFKLRIQGILADSRGNYAFNSDREFVAINLVEIRIPQGAEDEFENEILALSGQIASMLNWEVEDHETGNILFGKDKT